MIINFYKEPSSHHKIIKKHSINHFKRKKNNIMAHHKGILSVK